MLRLPNADREKTRTVDIFYTVSAADLESRDKFPAPGRRRQKSLYRARFVFNVYNRNVVPARVHRLRRRVRLITAYARRGVGGVGRSAARKTR